MIALDGGGRAAADDNCSGIDGDAGFVLDLKVHEGDVENENKNRMLVNTDAKQSTFMRLAL